MSFCMTMTLRLQVRRLFPALSIESGTHVSLKSGKRLIRAQLPNQLEKPCQGGGRAQTRNTLGENQEQP